MNDREILQWDKRLADQARRGWDNYKHLHIDLSVARIDQSYLIAGEYLYVENSSSALALAKIKLNRSNNDALDLENGVKIETVFIEIFITNDVIQDEWLDLVFGINFKYKKKVSGGGLIWVDRGDVANWDVSHPADLTADGAFHDWDLSAIIDAGAVLVLFSAYVRNTGPGWTLRLRQNGNVNVINADAIYTQVPNVANIGPLLVTPDLNGIVEYFLTPLGWTGVYIVVRGWWV